MGEDMGRQLITCYIVGAALRGLGSGLANSWCHRLLNEQLTLHQLHLLGPIHFYPRGENVLVLYA